MFYADLFSVQPTAETEPQTLRSKPWKQPLNVTQQNYNCNNQKLFDILAGIIYKNYVGKSNSEVESEYYIDFFT